MRKVCVLRVCDCERFIYANKDEMVRYSKFNAHKKK